MDLLSSKNHYERDERIQFSDSDHTYLIDKKNKAVLPDPEYLENFNQNLERMQKDLAGDE